MKFLPKVNQLCNRCMVDFFFQTYKSAHQNLSLFTFTVLVWLLNKYVGLMDRNDIIFLFL